MSEMQVIDNESLEGKVIRLEEELRFYKNKVSELENEKSVYENGDAKLYYSVQRKMSELSKMLNSNNLVNIDMASKSDATFDRVFKMLEKCDILSKTAESLGTIAGVTGDEEKDVKKRVRITPENMADSVGELAGKRS